MLRTRVLAAIAFTPAIFAVIWLGGLGLAVVCCALSFVTLWEYLQLVFGPGARYLKGLCYGLNGVVLLAQLDVMPTYMEILLLPAAALWMFIGVLFSPLPLQTSLQRAALGLFGVMYCAGLLPFLARLRMLPGDGLGLALLALLCTWASDTGAYFAGRAFGRHKLYPVISPAKTLEGGVGGLLAAALAALCIHRVLALNMSLVHALMLALVAAIAGALGDLCESMLKRSVGAKDSSRLIPGHGGVLDRFDGVMFAVPACYIYVMLFIHRPVVP